jgi:UDP-N-acetylglucosamine acyltransferase
MPDMTIHPSAIIDPTAELGANVDVGPFSYIGPHCKLGDGVKIGPNVVLQEYVTLGNNCQIAPGAVLGGHPQDLRFKGEVSYVEIGEGSIIRECVTINRSSGEGEVTRIGKKCMLMAYTHVAHNCVVGDEVIMANNVQLAGHIEVGDYAFIGGTCVFHQFVKIGRMSIISGFSASRQDIPPYAMVDGRPAAVVGINKVGLKRRGIDLNARTRLKQAFKLLWYSELNYKQAIEAIRSEIEMDPQIEELIRFVENSSRGIFKPTRILKAEAGDMASADMLAEVG